MAVFKCKMCGGTIEFEQGATVGVCDSCGTKQTLPRLDDDRKANLYDRANHFRRNNDFDKAMSIYEQILNEDNTDAEAYWSLVLCRYGIEYVEDPSTHKRVPTVNRAQFTSIFADEDYKSALQYADGYQKEIYEQEAKAIDDIQKGILAISQKEEPFDVFICYKETDNNGRRTPDSVLANDLYHQLTQEGFKVFFSRITLEDKLGTAYEPYIFAALNSAKVMVVLGTKPENFNAVWVKNEWSRYLALVKKSGGKKVLIPAYRDMDPYDLPEEFSHLQAQDMSKLGFMQDLIRGIKKIVSVDTPKAMVKETVVVNGGGAAVAPLLKRAFMFLEDGNWQEANEYCEKVLDQEPENAQAYLGKLMAELHVSKQERLANCPVPFDDSNNYLKAVRFGDEQLNSELNGYIAQINERNENKRREEIYINATRNMDTASTEAEFKALADKFASISGVKDADEKHQQCLEMAEEKKAEAEKKAEKNAKKKAEAEGRRKKAVRVMAISAAIVFIMIVVLAFKLTTVPDSDIEEGEYITFGAYEQDGDSSNGKEEIEWRVLEIEDDKALVISKRALDCQQYNTSNIDVTWETCTLRKWLNETFINNAFSTKEQAAIAETIVTADKNPEYDTDPGNATTDKVFLLSIDEVNKYFSSGSAATNRYWWLRTPGDDQNEAAFVGNDGAVYYDGVVYGACVYRLEYSVDYDGIAVRPAMWINLDTYRQLKQHK